LPFITSQLVLDGSTQPGFAGLPLIEISGATLGNNGDGFVIQSGGDGSTIRALAINHGWSRAILLQASNVIVEGCFIGTDPTGTSASANTNAVNLDFGFNVSGTRIGGTTAAARNLISGNGVGIIVQSGTGNIVEGNFIGTDVTGGSGIANGTDVDVRSSSNVIGGTTVAARNIIAGSGGPNGVVVMSGDSNLVQGNFIGLDVTGTKALGLSNAVLLTGGTNTLVGGLTATLGTPPGNVIASTSTGVFIAQGVGTTTVQGNLIGTNAAGTAALAGIDGVNIQGAFNIIGGTTTAARNVISGWGRHGIFLGTDNASVHDNLVQGNFIGTKINGTQFLGNGGDGIFVTVSTNNTIGGTAAGAGNVIAGNNANGIGIGINTGVTGLCH
jgi:hypothetical protein